MLTRPKAQKRGTHAVFGAVDTGDERRRGSTAPSASPEAASSAEDDSSDEEEDKPKVIVGEDEGGKKCAAFIYIPATQSSQRDEFGTDVGTYLVQKLRMCSTNYLLKSS